MTGDQRFKCEPEIFAEKLTRNEVRAIYGPYHLLNESKC